MKKSLFICLLLTMSMGLFAQEEVNLLATRSTSLNRDYLRPSMSKLFITDGSSISKRAIKTFLEIQDNKFDQNEIFNNVFEISSIPSDKSTRDETVKKKIESLISNEKIGNQIIKCWFPKFKNTNEGYDYDVLEKRGQFAATDNDILKLSASQRKGLLQELGESLIDRSYAIFYLVQGKTTTDKKGKVHESVDFIPYVYKLDFNKEVQADFYNNYFNKKEGIDECNFPMLYIMNAKSGITSSPEAINDQDYEDLMTIIGKHVADFQVKTPVYALNPIRAKIGTKEGVRVDKRFAIMEYRQDKDGNEFSKRVGNVRAKEVADNNSIATGNTEALTTFYAVKGRKIHEGMTLVENPDFGISIDAQYNLSSIDIAIGYRLSRLIGKIPGVIAYINAGILNDGGGIPYKVRAVTTKDGDEKNVPVLKAGLGIGKEFNFSGTFVLCPSIGAGLLWPLAAKKIEVNGNNASFDSSKSEIESYYIEGAVKFGYMCTRNVMAFIEGGYSLNILGKQFKFMRDWYAATEGEEAKDPGKVRIGLGTRIYF